MGVGGARGAVAARWFCAGFGVGFWPWAPGTAGSLLGVAVGVGCLRVSAGALAVAAVLVSVAGFFAIRWAVSAVEADADPRWIVIDEVAGQMLALVSVQPGRWWQVALAFALFRLLDITKPGPIGWADRRGGAAGIVADDLIAGALAAACVAMV